MNTASFSSPPPCTRYRAALPARPRPPATSRRTSGLCSPAQSRTTWRCATGVRDAFIPFGAAGETEAGGRKGCRERLCALGGYLFVEVAMFCTLAAWRTPLFAMMHPCLHAPSIPPPLIEHLITPCCGRLGHLHLEGDLLQPKRRVCRRVHAQGGNAQGGDRCRALILQPTSDWAVLYLLWAECIQLVILIHGTG